MKKLEKGLLGRLGGSKGLLPKDLGVALGTSQMRTCSRTKKIKCKTSEKKIGHLVA